MTEVFEFVYTDCIYESAMATLSLHKTKKGAYNAMRDFLVNGYMEWYNERIMYGKPKDWFGTADKFGTHCAWAVRSIALKE
jgi:hypothetical protein